MFRIFIFTSLFLFTSLKIRSQSPDVVIRNITVTGNHKTKANVLLREMDIKVGETISLTSLPIRIDENEKRILSTGLFSAVDINIRSWEDSVSMVDLIISVEEGWYLYPYPIFELADRNFNVWAKDFNYSFQRVNYGLAMTQINTTGNKDKLKLKFQFGYTGKYEIYYDFPYAKSGWGFSTNFLYSYNKEISYKTFQNRPVFFKANDEANLLKQFRFSFAVTQRKNAYVFQMAKLQYSYGIVDTSISKELNPSYFLNGETRLGVLRFEYEWVKNKLIYPLYPEGGYRLSINFKKDGFGESRDFSNTQLFSEYDRNWKLSKNLIYSGAVKGKINIQRNQVPYFYNQALGYNNDQITGYQLYVVDGTDFFYLKNALKWRIFEKDFKLQTWMPQRFSPFHTQLFIRCNVDGAYVHEPTYKAENPLSNDFLFGYGIAMDLIMFHNLLISCDYSLNKQGDSGFFFSGGFQF